MKILMAMVLLLMGSLQVTRPAVATYVPAQDVLVRDARCLELVYNPTCTPDTVLPGGTPVQIYYVLYRALPWGAIDPQLQYYVPIGTLGQCVEAWFGQLDIQPGFDYLVEKC